MADHLTDRLVKALEAPAEGYRLEPDDEVKGFNVRITAANVRSFVVRYRTKTGLQRSYTIGAFPDWKTAAARDEAKRIKRAVDGGGDPVGDERELRAAATVNELANRFEAEVLPRNRPKTRRNYHNQIRTEIRPALGKLKVEAVRFADIDKLHRELSERAPYQANRVIALLSRMFAMAVKWEMRSDNPCKGIERNAEDKRERYLSPEEIARLSDALDKFSEQQTSDIVRMLLLTGARVGETMQARWSDINLELGRWTKPSAHTKQRKAHVLPLSDAAVLLLRRIREAVPAACPFVFPADKDGTTHRREMKNGWTRICEMAEIENCRVHDLRHTAASILINQNYSLPIVGQLLGHTVPATTQRYAHLADDPLRRAVEDVAAVITGKPSAEVVALLPNNRRPRPR
jgi:integrase